MIINREHHIGIVGAGISGVTLAHELGKKGYRNVTILEKGDRVGGKCHSIEYKGKTYEMGALIGLPSYSNTMELMEQYGMRDKGPLLERGFFNLDGHRVSQIPVEMMPEFAREFKRLPELLGSYDSINTPGFADIPQELCVPFADWCNDHGIYVIKQVFMHYFSAFGFGSIYEIPAAYVMKLLNFDNLTSFIEITHMISWPKGVTELVKRISDQANDLRLTCEVIRMDKEESGKVRVLTNQGVMYFDKVIYTAPLRELPDKADLIPEDRKLLENIVYERFRVYAYRVENMPKVSGYIPGNMGPDRKGNMMAWYYRWADIAENDLITIYVAENESFSDSETRDHVEATLASLGGQNIRLYMMKRWNHFPHVSSGALKDGFYTKLERAQGKYGIYFAGEVMNFPTLENCIVYAKALVDRYF